MRGVEKDVQENLLPVQKNPTTRRLVAELEGWDRSASDPPAAAQSQKYLSHSFKGHFVHPRRPLGPSQLP